MKFGIVLTAGDASTMVELAVEAEAAGWDGVFYYDAIAIGAIELHDPWTLLGAIAVRTSRVRIGAILTPPARRRPWKLARETITVDRLSNGRLVLPVGLGTLDDAGFGGVGEPVDARTRAERLDETLEILAGLWTGEPFSFDGHHYQFEPMTFRPTPVQRPRIPIWVAALWPVQASMRRALRWDGILPQVRNADGRTATLEPAHVAAIARQVRQERREDRDDRPFDIVVEGRTPADDPAGARTIVEPWAAASATWWTEADWEGATVDSLRQRINAGPPRTGD